VFRIERLSGKRSMLFIIHSICDTSSTQGKMNMSFIHPSIHPSIHSPIHPSKKYLLGLLHKEKQTYESIGALQEGEVRQTSVE